MKVTPLDLRQAKLRVVMRGYDRNEVDALLSEVADDYEQALRESDRLHQELLRLEAVVTEHREHERNLRNTLLTAQRLSDEIREHAELESRRIVEDAESRAELVLQKSEGRIEEVQREIDGLKLRRRDVETTLQSTIATLRNALQFVREQDQKERDDKILLHRPRQVVPEPQAQAAPQAQAVRIPRPQRPRRRRRGIVSITADFVIRRTRQVVTCAGPAPRRGPAQADVSAIPNGVVASLDGRIVFVGSEAAFDAGVRTTPDAVVVDAGGGTVLPGFVDPHTHVVYAGDRREELRRRLAGATYAEIAAAGGGILGTVRATREASEDALVESARVRLVEMLQCGTTTAEAKSGYGLETAAELKMLRAIRRLGQTQPIDLAATFLGAHEIPDGIPRPPCRLHRPRHPRDDPGRRGRTSWRTGATSSAKPASTRRRSRAPSWEPRRRPVSGFAFTPTNWPPAAAPRSPSRSGRARPTTSSSSSPRRPTGWRRRASSPRCCRPPPST